MSIEQTIAANTAALEANTAAIAQVVDVWTRLLAKANSVETRLDTGAITGITAAGVAVTPAEVKAPKAKQAEKPAPTPTVPETATPAPAEVAAPAPAAESPSEPVEVTIEQLSAAVTAAATRGPASRDGLIKLLTERGVKRASELPKDQWAGLLPVLETL